MVKNTGVIQALFLNMGKKVLPYFKMTAEVAQDMHKTFAKLMMYVKDKKIKLTQKQQQHISDQLEQLRLYDEKQAARLAQQTKGPKAEVIQLSEKLPESAPYSEKNPTGWMPTKGEAGFNQNLVDNTVELLMSKSDPNSGVFIHNTDEEIKKKMNKAWCEEANIQNNPLLEIAKTVIFHEFDEMSVERPEKFGGNVSYQEIGRAHV